MAKDRSKIKSALGGPKENGIEGNFQAGIGRQLTNRVNSGAITQNQAQKIAAQRRLLRNAFGDNWRQKVFGNPEGAKGIGGPFARGQIAADRSQALERAKKKMNINGGTTAP